MTSLVRTAYLNVAASVYSDVRYTLRGLKNAPGYAFTIILTLALGLGAVTTMLAVVDCVLLRPVALPHPEQLVTLALENTRDHTSGILSYSQIESLRRNTQSFSAISGYFNMLRPVSTTDGSRTALLTEVTPDFFTMLGVHPKFGRLITSQDEKSPVAVVSAAFWRDRLRADPKAIGSTIKFNGQQHIVIGVLPEGTQFPQGIEAPVVYSPIVLSAKQSDDLFTGYASVLARLKPGASTEQARGEAQSVLAHARTKDSPPQETLILRSYQQQLTGDLRASLLTLLGGVSVLLLIACANAANLQITRITSRMAEMNLRSALGASISRLLQQLVIESLVASLFGATFGAALAYVLVTILRAIYGQQFARFDELTIHPASLLACTLLALLTGLLASLAPMFGIRRHTDHAATATLTVTRSARLPQILVALQIAMTCVLLVTIALFVKTFSALENVKLGFDPHGITDLVLMPYNQNQDPEVSRRTVTRLLEKFAAIPGVQAVAMQSSVPFSNFNVGLNGATEVNGRAFRESDTAFYSLVSSNFVSASGIHLLRGRDFQKEDDSSAAMVGLVNEAFVRQYLPTRDPIGATVKLHRAPGETDADLPFAKALTIIGVVENELQGGDLAAPYQPMVYIDYRQVPTGAGFAQVFSFVDEFAIRSNLGQIALNTRLRAIIQQTAPDMSELNLQLMQAGIAQSLSQRRLALSLVASFGAIALLLACIGIYGVLTYSVIQRRKEIAIRMALGSSRAAAIKLIVQQAGRMVVVGFILGAAAAWPAGRAVKSFLFGVQALDSTALLSSAAVLLAVCAAAAAIPALRAAQTDPIEALRAE